MRRLLTMAPLAAAAFGAPALTRPLIYGSEPERFVRGVTELPAVRS